MDTDDDLDELQDQERTRLKNKLPQDLKPCVAKMLGTPLSKGNTFGRSEVAVIIAVEFKRLGREKKQALTRILRWNRDNRPPFRPSEIHSAVNRAYERKYDYGCNNPTVVNFCFYKNRKECPFYQKIKRSAPGRIRELDFYDKGWPQVLELSDQVLYLAIRRIEKLQGKRAGQMVVAPYRLLAKYTGLNIGYIGKCLGRLKDAKLIDYKKGEQHSFKVKSQSKATEIIRKKPIPKPCKNADF